MARPPKRRVGRKRLSRKYRARLETLAAMLFRFDPIGINFGGNADEYDAEAETILPRLAGCHGPDDVQSVVFEEFCQWFSPGVAGSRASYLGVSVAIWNWWHRRPILEPSG